MTLSSQGGSLHRGLVEATDPLTNERRLVCSDGFDENAVSTRDMIWQDAAGSLR